MQTLRVQFNIPQSPITKPIDLFSSKIQSTPPNASQPRFNSGSTPTSDQIRENPFNTPATTEQLPYWTTQAFTEGEPNVANEPIDVSSDPILSLPETLSLTSTPSLSQISSTPFPLNFPTNLELDMEKIHLIIYPYD